ncbi:MAG TPA: CPBP family intramembrane glutamic endopeptidase [Roseiflexaceae bacterium]|nr:CPBP family intramembrane glutamic endopeptidase [Roseiflexaceae bacterium]
MSLTTPGRARTIRNLVIFTLVTAGAGFVGIGLDRLAPPPDPMQGLGALVWLVSPLAANLLLRSFGGDGWGDLGLGPKVRAGWKWYLLALLIVPITTLPSLLLAPVFGAASLAGFARQGGWTFLSLAGAAFGAAAVKNIFEEFAWRGYLTPRFAALGLHPMLNAVLTGVIWASWHVPYYLYFLDRAVLQAHTPLSVAPFILLTFVLLPFHAFAYGKLRQASRTVWTTWLLHTVANAISLTMLSNGFVTVARDFRGVLLSPGTEGVLVALTTGLSGYMLYRSRTARTAAGSVEARHFAALSTRSN